MPGLEGPLKAALLGGLIVGAASFLAENADPVPAGLISTIPIALPAIWFLSLEGDELKSYSKAFVAGMGAYVVAAFVFYNLHIHRKIPRGTSLIVAMSVWVGLCLLAYVLLGSV